MKNTKHSKRTISKTTSTDQKKKKTPLIITLIILLLVGSSITYILLKPRQTASSALKPIKTTAPDAIVPPTSVSIAPAPEVKDTGEAGWVQVKSKTKLDKFTDLSVPGVTIYRANNPKVLKTAAAQIPGTFMMSDIVAQYPDYEHFWF